MSEVERITIAELKAKIDELENEKKDLKIAWRTSVKFGYELEKENEKLREQLEAAEKLHNLTMLCPMEKVPIIGLKEFIKGYRKKYLKEG